MKTFIFLFSIIVLMGCSSEPEVKTTIEYVEPINASIQESDIQIPEQSSVINEENLESSYLGQSILLHYSQGSPGRIDSTLSTHLQEICFNDSILYHAYETDDNKGLIHIKDDLFFDLKKYMIKSHNGIVAIKDKKILFINLSDATVNIDSNVTSFFAGL